MPQFTTNDILLYISSEKSETESKTIEIELINNKQLFLEYQHLSDSWEQASQFRLSPSDGFTNRLLNRLNNFEIVQ